MKLFYSWQSDIPQNRAVIQKCIREATKAISDFELETATRDMTGSPDIAATILAKISESDMIIADVTIINHASGENRQTPNPNVMYELGYAVGKLGEANVILIANAAITDTAQLPFDIRNRRMILVDFKKANASKEITDSIVNAIKGFRPQEKTEGQAPQAFLSEPDATWASNYGGYGASFRSVIAIDNYGGRNDYIISMRIEGTNADGTPFVTDRFNIEKEQPNHPHPIAADDMQILTVFLSLDHNNHRPMPDLDRDTVSLAIEFRSGKTISLPIHIRQS